MSETAQPTTRVREGCLHLPVAGRINFRRRFGGLTPGRALEAGDVAEWLGRVEAEGVRLTGLGISGPGDPLADPEVALEALRTAHEKHPDLPIFLVTSGMCPQGQDIAELAKSLMELGLSRVTVLVDAVDPALVEQIFAWIRPGRRTVPLPEAARYFVDAQARAVKSFREAGAAVTVRMTVYPGINDRHVDAVANVASVLGAEFFDLRPYSAQVEEDGRPPLLSTCSPEDCMGCSLAGNCCTPAADLSELGEETPELEALPAGRLEELRHAAERYIRLAPEAAPHETEIQPTTAPAAGGGVNAPMLPRPSGSHVNVAVASTGGLDVDTHLGQAGRFLIYGPRPEDGLHCLLGTREAPKPGGGDQRWVELAQSLRDCFAVLASGAGNRPREILAQNGIKVLATETDVAAAVDALFGGPKRPRRRVKVD